jgi:hypothetical protein
MLPISFHFLSFLFFYLWSLEERVAKIEGILEQMDKRLNHIKSDISNLRNEMLVRFDAFLF